MNIKDAAIAAIPDFVVLKESRRLFLSHLNKVEISNSLIRKGDKVLIAQERKETEDESDEEQGESDSIETDTTRFHRCNLAMPREHTQGEKSGEQNSIGKSPLKGHLWNATEKVFKDETQRSPIFDEDIYFLEEEDEDVNENQAAEGQAKDPQIFRNHVSLEGPVTFKHLR